MRVLYLRLFLIFTMFFPLSGCVQQNQYASLTADQPVAVTLPPVGLKKLVAVETFENQAGFGSEINLGNGMADMLTDSLIQSGYFNVMERQAIESVLTEQDFSASGRTVQAGSTAQIGKVLPVQLLIRGSVTEYDTITTGGDQGLNIRGVTVNMQRSTAHVAVIIRLIDTTTGQVIDSQRVEGKAESGGLGFGYAASDFDFFQSGYKKTPIGEATQIAIDRAVEYIIRRMSSIPWEGKVVTARDNEVIINAGLNAGIKQGDRFAVYRPGQEFIDPDTGMSLGAEMSKIGEVEAVGVQDKFARAVPVTGSGFAARDILRFERPEVVQPIIDQQI
ncbi:MAG: CsgG/HfaB family protein [Candidatus Auribacterota bacterium]|nr:CsgG/HfaB family protein [Candidatus Auribacterota bacterium]